MVSREVNETLGNEAISKLIEAFDCKFHSIKKINSAVLMHCPCFVAFAEIMLVFTDILLLLKHNDSVV